jgi:phosphohistidine phosphatase
MTASGHTLVLLRHGKSDWSGGEPDLLRPLAGRGRRQAAEAGHWIAGHLPGLGLAVVSSAERAHVTWQIAAAELDVPPPVRLDERAYAATGPELLSLVRELPDDLGAVVLVGHNPGLEDLAESLTGSWVHLPTSAIAVLALAGPWSAAGPSSATLTASGRPPRS